MPLSRDELHGFRNGREAVLSALFRRHRREVEGLLRRGFTFDSGGESRRFSGFANPLDLEDRVHDVFVRAFSPEARRSYDGVSDFTPWLMTIARNVAISHLRSRDGRFDHLAVRGADLESADEGRLDALILAAREPDGGAAHPPWEHAEILRVAQAFLDGLDEPARQVMALRFRRRLALERAAAELGVSAPTLRRRERALFEAFFEHMGAHGYFEHHAVRRDLRTRRASGAALVLLGILVSLP